ncbi:MAG: SDR family oxidoreductase [Candidatus Cloacimonetes bacterium]|nr:SDR family oxidoreductase [Candidatus Cloacimonadota bacterium]
MKQGYLVISGANGQVGSHLARFPQLAQYPQLLLYHQRQDRLQGLDKTPNRLLKQCNLMDIKALTACIQEANDHFGCLPTRLIHTAAVRSSDAAGVAECDPDVFSHTLNTNLMAAVNILHSLLPHSRKAGFGRYILYGSVVTATGLVNGAAYAAAKAAIVNLAKSVALENAAHDILINCISPGPIATDLSADYEGEYLEFRKRYFEAYIAKSPTHKLISVQELAEMSVLLISDALENLTGQEIIINGGSL